MKQSFTIPVDDLLYTVQFTAHRHLKTSTEVLCNTNSQTSHRKKINSTTSLLCSAICNIF
ncbi:uncharacterized protein LOC113554603 isoform X2 [Rhopalosiphum maidis]|uniref:uncharacterized protein LOC113554603 isoform X2 n=1 Tax=Rhopalosiphum maidis TaxID=43146 RepID=UPI000F0026DB|nr:uncharacterized protein LOC113554603 isoform X2 [Rhopalosiphum maidis]